MKKLIGKTVVVVLTTIVTLALIVGAIRLVNKVVTNIGKADEARAAKENQYNGISLREYTNRLLEQKGAPTLSPATTPQP